MGSYLRILILIFVVFGVGWLIGDCYGVDGWIVWVIDLVFVRVDFFFGEGLDLIVFELVVFLE